MRIQPIEIDVPSVGSIKLRRLTLGSMKIIQELRAQQLEPRDFTIHVLYAQQIEPVVSLEDLAALPDATLCRIAQQWTEHLPTLNVTLPVDTACFTTLQDALNRYMDERTAALTVQMTELARSVVPQHVVADAQASAARYLKLLDWEPRRIFTTVGMSGDIRPIVYKRPDAFDWSGLSTAITTLANINLQSTFDRLSETLQGVVKFKASMDKLFTVSSRWFDLGSTASNIIQRLPDLAELVKYRQDLVAAQQTLEESGYLFAAHLWETTFVLSFASTHPRVQRAVATNRLLAETRREEFTHTLQTILQQSKILRRRAAVIEHAYTAHQRRNYMVSIPLLLMQLEGIIADALILKGVVVEIDGKLYQRGADGNPVLHSRGTRVGQPVEVPGLTQLVLRSGYKDDDVLHLTAELITDQLAPERNKILHGRMTSYAQAHRSVRTLLCVFILAQALAEFEQQAPR